MRKGIFCFLIGIVVFQLMPELPARYWLALVPIVVLGMWPRSWFRWLGCVILGFLWMLWRADLVLTEPTIDEALRGQDLVVVGWVQSLPESSHQRLRFLFRPSALWHQGTALPVPPLIRLSWYNVKDMSLEPGQWLALTVRLKPPRGFSNAGGFDYECWLFQQHIRATGYVRQQLGPDQLQNLLVTNPELAAHWGAKPWSSWVDRGRARLQESLQLVNHAPATNLGLVHALAIGVRTGIDNAHWEVLRKTGTSHLVAISGLHIGLVAGFGFFFVQWVWARSRRLPSLVPAPKAAALGAVVCAVVYSALAGFAVPTQRAVVMTTVAMVLRLAQGRLLSSHVLSLALVVVLIIDPLAVLAPGFWLSFAAVAVIIFSSSGRLRTPRWWWQWTRVHWVVALGLTPFLLFYFQRTSLIAPVANVLAVPWVSFICVPLVLAATLVGQVSKGLGEILLQLALYSLDAIWEFLAYLAALPWAEWVVPAPALWTLIPALTGMCWLLAPRGWPARWLGGLAILPVLLNRPAGLAPGVVNFTLLDVGQGLAAVVRTAHHTLVYDTGPRFGPDFDAGAAVLVPYLQNLDVRQVDILIISHGDSDHVGGVSSLLAAVAVETVIAGAHKGALPRSAQPCQGPRDWRWDGVVFQILYPLGGGDDDQHENNGSCVLKVTVPGAGSLLLPGDIEARAENDIALHYGHSLRSRALIVPHHGSTTSSSEIFLQMVEPQVAFVATGKGNRFGFPKKIVVERYQQRGIKLFDTAIDGAIDFQILPEGGVNGPNSRRARFRHYWQAPP